MKRIVILFFGLMLGIGIKAVNYEIVPLPQHIQIQKGDPFLLHNKVQILMGSGLQQEATFLQAYLRELTGYSLTVSEKRQNKTVYIELRVSPEVTEAEGYILTVTKKGITITGGSAAGVFYGIQTLRKAVSVAGSNDTNMPEAVVTMPAVVIKDYPRFSWRGMHLDCSRHFFPVPFIKKFIDLLAMHNMNIFHWHLTDDQGWRIEIRKWPRLMEIGSQRSGTVIGTNSDLDDEMPYGGYYTQAEARDIVAYAAERHITVIPEIDMPGHMLAALASYPELGCTGGSYQVGHFWGVYKDVLCAGNPKVYQFVEDVLTEIMDIFPSEVIHIGGDETPTEKWETCPRCQKVSAGLQANETLQGYFTRRVFDFLAKNNRRALGWDELLENNAPASSMIMSWRGSAPGAKAAALGHDVIMSPTTHCYFDYQQVEETLFEPSRCGGYIPIERVYSLDPAPDSLSVEVRNHILGTQANLWSEYMTTESTVEYQALPRMSAIAEVQWTLPAHKDYAGFKQRLTRLTELYDNYHYRYCKHLWPDRQMPNRWKF